LAKAVSDSAAKGGWIWPILGVVFGYGLGSALVLYFLADLVVRPHPAEGHFPQLKK
jgi:Na+/proline symporter